MNEEQQKIFFHAEDRKVPDFINATWSAWIEEVVREEHLELFTLNFIFCSDDYLLQINQDNLGHNTYTDIITFDNSEGDGQIEGDIFISIDRVEDNAADLRVTFQEELMRVVIHGVLHLCGYDDKTKEEHRIMRDREDRAIHLLN